MAAPLRCSFHWVSSCHVRVYKVAHPSSVPFQGCPAVTCRVNGLDTTGLVDSGWSSVSSDGHAIQSVINAASRLVFSARKYDHITPLLREHHWLTYSLPHGGALPGGAQFSAVVSLGRNSPCVWRLLWTTTAIGIDGDSNRYSLEAQQYDWQPSFSHCRGECMEHLAGRHHICAVTASFKWRLKTELFNRCYTSVSVP